MKNFFAFVLIVVVGIIASMATVRVMNAAHTDRAKTENVYDRVIRTGTLRCAYTPYSIGLMKDPNTGQLSGIYHDVIETLAANLNLKVEWGEEVGWGNQIEGLNAGRYDLICSPASLNSGRARAADFSIPLYYSPVHIWARKDDATVNADLKALDEPAIRISTLDGEQTSVFADQFFPHAKKVSLPQSSPFSDLMLQVTTGKADIVFAEPLTVQEFLKNNPGSLRQVTPNDAPLLVVPNIILLPRGQFEFKEMIDNGLREMFNSHLIDRIIDKYEKLPNSYIRETARR